MRVRAGGLAVVLALVAAGPSACGFGEYHTKSSGDGGATGSTSSGETTTSSTMKASSSTGGPACPMGDAGLAIEDCWTLESETAQTNAACAALPAGQKLPREDTATARSRIQRLRLIPGTDGTPRAFALGSTNRGAPSTPNKVNALFSPASDLDAVFTDQPQADDKNATDFAESTDYAGDLNAGFLAGYAFGSSTPLGTDDDTPHLFALNVELFDEPNMTGHVTGSLEASAGGAYSRMLAIASTDTKTAPTFGAVLSAAGSGVCGGAAGIFGTRMLATEYTLPATDCVLVASPCATPPNNETDDVLVPWDVLLTSGGAILAGQSCGSLGVTSGRRTGVVVKLVDGTPPTVAGGVPAAQVIPKDLQSTADIAGIRALDADHFVLAGTFQGQVTAGAFTLTSAGGTDGFVAVLDASFAFTQAIALGGAGDEVISDLFAVSHDATLPEPHTEWGVLLVGHVDGATTWGCWSVADAGVESAYLAKLRFPTLDSTTSPEVLFFEPLGRDAPTRAERVVADGTTVYVSGRLSPGGALATADGKIPGVPFTNAATFVVTLPTNDAVTP